MYTPMSVACLLHVHKPAEWLFFFKKAPWKIYLTLF